MTQVVVSIGSNHERERHIQACLDALQAEFNALRISRVFESEPVGCRGGRNFFNLVATFDSVAAVGELQAWCKRLERACGRRQAGSGLSATTLDIDLLSVGELTGTIDGVELPRGGITRHAFVLRPLAELLPADRHPVTGQRYADLWASFEAEDQRLWPVDFSWHGQRISRADRDSALF